jgi:hemolysin activation/secretion protein
MSLAWTPFGHVSHRYGLTFQTTRLLCRTLAGVVMAILLGSQMVIAASESKPTPLPVADEARQTESAITAQGPINTPAPSPVEEAPTFDIFNYQVDGNSVLDVELVEMAVYPYLGPGKRIEDVEKARQALEAAYRGKGYPTVVVDIPEQDVQAGIVKLKVVEGSVEYLDVTGARYYSQGKILEGIPALAKGKVPYMPAVQAQMVSLAKESPDRVITPVFRAGSTPGKTEVELKVKDEFPLHASVEINGRNTEDTTRTRLVSSIRYDNLWQKFHSASLQYQVSPQNSDEVQVWSGTYVMPTGWKDSRLAMYGIGISSNTELGATVGGTAVVGTGDIFGFRFIKPLPEYKSLLHSVVVGLDYKNFDQSVTLVGEDTGSTPIDYMPLVVSYDGTIRGETFTTTLATAGHLGIRGIGSNTQQFDEKRLGARPDFFYFTTEFKHQHELPYDLLAVTRAGGQISDQPLISNEQYAVGGMQSVRGYYQTQQLGDSGVNLSFELQSPRLLPAEWETVDYLRALTFFDWGYLWVEDPLPTNPSYYHLASTGVGLRSQIMKHFIGELDWGYPFNRQGTVTRGHQRIDFRLMYEF